MPSRSASNRKKTPASPDPGRKLLRFEIWGLVLAALGVVTLISLASRGEGKLTAAWSLLLRRIFGLGAYPVAGLIVLAGLALLFRQLAQALPETRWQTYVGLEVAFFAGLGLIHVAGPTPYWLMASEGRGGGIVGWAAAQLLVPLIGRTLSLALLSLLVALGIFWALGIPWAIIAWRLRWLWAQFGLLVRKLGRIGQARRPKADVPRARAPRTGRPKPAQVAAPSPAPSARSRRRAETAQKRPARQPAAPKTPAGLPSLDLLIPDQDSSSDDADARERAQIIEETLAAFGIPATVAEWHRGPVVTQFGVEPGYVERQDREGNTRRFKIRVSKILSLSNDLALALAAAPIRIEAPVPGRAVVGIEVPNNEKALVGLRGVLESAAFRKTRSRLKFALGRDVSGEAVVTDLAQMPHLLIAGATGSGKSVCLNAVIVSLLANNTPEQVRMLLIDPKRVELTKYNGTPHLIAPVVVDVEKVIGALRWVTREMDRRYQAFADSGARNLASYNRMAGKGGREPLPLIVVIVDELADLMFTAAEDVERTICRLAQMARATGIHLVIATQRPSVDVVTGLIKANFPARISFAVTSQVDSRVILDGPGAEKLLGRGDMLFMTPDSAKLRRIQGCFVSDPEIDAVVAFWHQRVPQDWETLAGPAPWDEGGAMDEGPQDAMLQEAIDLVRQHQHASASFLQRHLHIGYPRAGRLIDQLEELGVVGPPEQGGRSRQVLDDEMASAAATESPSPDAA